MPGGEVKRKLAAEVGRNRSTRDAGDFRIGEVIGIHAAHTLAQILEDPVGQLRHARILRISPQEQHGLM